jgi:hypothetical protein
MPCMLRRDASLTRAAGSNTPLTRSSAFLEDNGFPVQGHVGRSRRKANSQSAPLTAGSVTAPGSPSTINMCYPKSVSNSDRPATWNVYDVIVPIGQTIHVRTHLLSSLIDQERPFSLSADHPPTACTRKQLTLQNLKQAPVDVLHCWRMPCAHKPADLS